MKLAFVVGHNHQSQGAVRADTNETEFVWNSRLANMIEDAAQLYDDLEVRTFFRQPVGSYTREIERVYEQTDEWGADATIEGHFNGAESPDATGTEVLTSGTPASMRLAVEVQAEMVAALGLRDRGVKTRRSGRGSASLISGRAPAILIEPFFGSSALGQDATDELIEQKRLARGIVRGAARALGAMPRKDLSESRTIATVETATKRGKQAGAGILGLIGIETAPEILDVLQTPGLDLSAIVPIVQENATALIIGAVVALILWRGPAVARQLIAFREEDHRKQLR